MQRLYCNLEMIRLRAFLHLEDHCGVDFLKAAYMPSVLHHGCIMLAVGVGCLLLNHLHCFPHVAGMWQHTGKLWDMSYEC